MKAGPLLLTLILLGIPTAGAVAYIVTDEVPHDTNDPVMNKHKTICTTDSAANNPPADTIIITCPKPQI